jgi:hypothetical protein
MPGIWKMPIEGGAETRISDQPDGSDWFDWGVTERGIYFLDSKAQPAAVKFLEFATGQQFPIFSLSNSPNLGLTVSPADRSLVFGQPELAESSNHVGEELPLITEPGSKAGPLIGCPFRSTACEYSFP